MFKWSFMLAVAGLIGLVLPGWAQPAPKFLDATGADNFKVHFITKAKTPPVIDGEVDDAVWKQADVIDDFGPCEYGARLWRFPKTEVRYLWDDKYLYVAITCYETPANMKRHNIDTDDKAQAIYSRDCMELHINGNNDNVTRFQTWFIDTGEKQIFWFYDFGWGLLVNENYGLSADWNYASARKVDRWQCEGRFALADFQIQPKAGYIFGMNPCRFRFNKTDTMLDGSKTQDDITQFLSWSTQGGDHHDVRAYGKCILVNAMPATVADGLKLAYPDLDKRTVLVQTGDGFAVFDHGKQYKQSYLEKVTTDLEATRATADKLKNLLADKSPAATQIAQYGQYAGPQLEKLDAVAAGLQGKAQITAAEMNTARKDLQVVNGALDDMYWNAQRILLLAEGTAREKVDLTPAYNVPTGLDEPENTPDPHTRKTAQIPWAKNYVTGRTRALIVTGEGASWDAYELLQRMDLDADIFYCTVNVNPAIGPDTDYYKEGILLYPQKKAQLQKLLANPYDAYIFLDVSPNVLPPDLQYVVTQKLLNGAAVVVFQSRDWDFPGLAAAKIEKDTALRESMPWRSMTRLAPSGKSWLTNTGADIQPLDRGAIPLEVPPVTKITVGKGHYANFQPGGGGYFYTSPLTPHFEQDPDELFQAEYYYGLAAKIILDAAGKRAPQQIGGINCGNIASGIKGTATATLGGPAFQGQMRVVVRSQWGKILSDTRQPLTLAGGQQQTPLAIPALGAGNYYLEAWLLQNDKVVDWASQRFSAQGAAKIAEVKLDNATVAEGKTLTAEVTVAGASPAARLRAEVRDINGRISQRKAGITITNGKARITVNVGKPWCTEQHLDLYLDDGGAAVDRKTAEFFVNRAEHDDFSVYTDGSSGNYYGVLRNRVLRDIGVDIFESWNAEDLLGVNGDIGGRWWLSASTNETGGSLASDAFHKNLDATLQQFARMYAARGGRFISTGDDSGVASDFTDTYPNWVMPLIKRFAAKYRYQDFWQIRGVPNASDYAHWMWSGKLSDILAMKLQPGDFELFLEAFKEAYPTIAEFNRANGTAFAGFEAIKPEDLKTVNPPFVPDVIGFQDWLKAKYRTIDALNAVWGTAEKSFETIRPGQLIQELTAAGKNAANLDKQTYLEDLFIREMRTAGRAVHAVDPNMGVGQGAASFDNIIPEVLQGTDTYVPYLADVNIEIGRSFPHKWVGQTLGVYGGKAVKAPARTQQTWHVLFTGGNFIWYWSASTGVLMGDLSMNLNRSGAMAAAIHEMKQGIASCLLRGQRRHDGIAILHSRASGNMGGIIKEMGTQGNSEVAFQRIIEDQGLQYRYISTQNVEGGVLRAGEFKMLLLPYTQILTPKEVTEIEQFVKDGGAVIADLRAGTFSVDGKALNPGALDALFGVTRNDPRANAVRGPLTITGLGPAPCTVDGFQADASITAGAAKAYGRIADAPALLVNTVGKGKAILINLGLTGYDFQLTRNELQGARQAFTDLLALAGVKSRFQVTAGGKAVPGVELAVFTRGDAQFLTAEKRSFEFEKYPMPAEIALDGMYYVTDMRSGKAYGLTDRIPVTLEGLSCHVWSLLPYQVTDLQVKLPNAITPGVTANMTVTLKTTGKPAPHIIRVEVLSPGGAAPYAMRLLDTKDGALTCPLPVAYNDEPGSWTVKVTDVATGMSRTVKYTVKAAK